MSVVADISVVLAWLYEEEQTAQALIILGLIEHEGLLVPPLWWYELENGVLIGEKRGRKSPVESDAFLELVRALPIRTDEGPRASISEDILRIGRANQLTAYDAAYLELAIRMKAPLATFDTALRRSAAKSGVTLVPNVE